MTFLMSSEFSLFSVDSSTLGSSGDSEVGLEESAVSSPVGSSDSPLPSFNFIYTPPTHETCYGIPKITTEIYYLYFYVINDLPGEILN